MSYKAAPNPIETFVPSDPLKPPASIADPEGVLYLGGFDAIANYWVTTGCAILKSDFIASELNKYLAKLDEIMAARPGVNSLMRFRDQVVAYQDSLAAYRIELKRILAEYPGQQWLETDRLQDHRGKVLLVMIPKTPRKRVPVDDGPVAA